MTAPRKRGTRYPFPMARAKRPPSRPLERKILRDIRVALGLVPDLVLWRNSVAVATSASGNVQRFGLCPGSSDLIGILGPTGRFIALEVKRPREQPSDEQLLFLALVRRRGGFACVVRSVADATDAIDRARNGASE